MEERKKEVNFIPVSSIIEENGKTIRENNMEKKHNIPLGTLVEVKREDWFGDGACEIATSRMFVVVQGRDCDGTPLYWLSKRYSTNEKREVYARDILEFHLGIKARNKKLPDLLVNLFDELSGGYVEEHLTPIKITTDLKDGYGALEHRKIPKSLTDPVKENCTICGEKKEIRRHLSIFLIGSEGTLACEDCYKELLEFARKRMTDHNAKKREKMIEHKKKIDEILRGE